MQHMSRMGASVPRLHGVIKAFTAPVVLACNFNGADMLMTRILKLVHFVKGPSRHRMVET